MPVFFRYLLFFFFSALTVFVQPATAAVSQDEQAAFQQAIAFDLAGKPREARGIYDSLLNSYMPMPDAAVPSAINLYALGRFAESMSAFKAIQGSANRRDAEYASLWVLLLTARNGGADLERKLAYMAEAMHFSDAANKHIADMFAKKISAVQLLKNIVLQNDVSFDPKKQDVVTQTVFFASSYLTWVLNDKALAKQMVDKTRHFFLFESLERPLME
ncbi:MAG: hypothetical protein LBN41_11395 [Enterobacteriaceae bacterium]|nr:hypothetical protein [Enterobacteriaceae bacterium]